MSKVNIFTIKLFDKYIFIQVKYKVNSTIKYY